MKLIQCTTCGHSIAAKAKTCPNCGAKLRHSVFWRIVLALFITIVVIPGVIHALSSGGLPDCDSMTGIGLAKDQMNEKLIDHGADMQVAAMERGSNASVVNDEVIDIDDAQEVSHDDQSQTRSCVGVAETKLSGKVRVSYSFRMLNDGTINVDVGTIPR